MSQSIEKLATDLSAQVKILAEEKSTYTERMQKMEDAMEAYRAKCDRMEATMAEYATKMEEVMKANEDNSVEDEKELVDPNAPTPEPQTAETAQNDLGGVNEEKMLEKMPKKDEEQKRKREGMPDASVVASAPVAEVISTDAKEEPKVETKAEEVVTKVAEEGIPLFVAEVVAPKAEEVVPVIATVASIDPALVAKIAEVASVKEALAQEVKVRDEALATVTKMKAEFESMLERIAKVEAQEMKAEKTIAKKVAELAVEPVASATGEQEIKTDGDLVKEFTSLQSQDPKAARSFYLKNQEAIRKATWGNFKKA